MLTHKKITELAVITLLLCLLCFLPAVMPLTVTEVDTIWFVDENGIDWWLLSNSITYPDRWYLVIELIGSCLIMVSVLAMLRSNRERAALGVSVKSWLWRYITVVLFLFILAWATVSMLLSGRLERCLWGTGYRHDGLFSYMIYGGIMLSSCVLARKGERCVRIVLECLALVGTVSALVILLEADGLWLEVSDDLRAGFFFHYNHQGYFNTMTWTACAVLFFPEWKRTSDTFNPMGRVKTWGLRIFRTAELWLLTNELMECQVRGAFLSVLFAAVLMNIFLLPRKELRPGVLLMDALFLLTITLLNTDSGIYTRLSKSVEEAVTILQGLQSNTLEQSTLDKAASGRGRLWRYGLQLVAEKPLFGFGPDNLGEQYYAVSYNVDRPDNLFIQIAAMLGIPALLAFVGALAIHYLRILRRIKRCGLLCIGCACITAAYMTNMMFGNTMFYITPYFFMCFGFSMGLYLKDTEEKKQLVEAGESYAISGDI